jgi:hypothetical protein
MSAASNRRRLWHNSLDMLCPRRQIAGRAHAGPLHLLLVLICCVPYALAQGPPPATVKFSLDFPGSDPEHYAITVASDGHSTYESNGKLSVQAEEGDPYRLEFSLSQTAVNHIFDQAKRARYFDGEIDSKKKNIASTGAKVLAYKDATRRTQASYNYSPNPAVQELTRFFQNLSGALEFGRRLQFDYRYQKLALDEELRSMEAFTDLDPEGLRAISPILNQIAHDPTVINVVRARALKLLAIAGP